MTKNIKTLFILFLLFSCSFKGFSQANDYKLILGTQVDLSFLRSKQQIASLLIGLKAKDSSQVLVGPFIKYFNNEIGHQKIHVGLRIHAHIPVFKNWYAGITANYVVNGQFYLTDGSQTKTIHRKSSLIGNFSLGYAIKQNLFVFTGITFSDYQPLNYYLRQSSPFRTNYGNLNISYHIEIKKNAVL